MSSPQTPAATSFEQQHCLHFWTHSYASYHYALLPDKYEVGRDHYIPEAFAEALAQTRCRVCRAHLDPRNSTKRRLDKPCSLTRRLPLCRWVIYGTPGNCKKVMVDLMTGRCPGIHTDERGTFRVGSGSYEEQWKMDILRAICYDGIHVEKVLPPGKVGLWRRL